MRTKVYIVGMPSLLEEKRPIWEEMFEGFDINYLLTNYISMDFHKTVYIYSNFETKYTMEELYGLYSDYFPEVMKMLLKNFYEFAGFKTDVEIRTMRTNEIQERMNEFVFLKEMKVDDYDKIVVCSSTIIKNDNHFSDRKNKGMTVREFIEHEESFITADSYSCKKSMGKGCKNFWWCDTSTFLKIQENCNQRLIDFYKDYFNVENFKRIIFDSEMVRLCVLDGYGLKIGRIGYQKWRPDLERNGIPREYKIISI